MPNDPAPADEVDTADTQAANDDWRTILPEDIRDNPTIGKYTDVGALAAAHINLQSHLGRDKIARPVTEDDWNEVYNFLGRPEAPDAYKVELPDDLPDPVRAQFSDENIASFYQTAHQLGLTQAQVEGLAKWQAENTAGQYQALEQNAQQTLEEAERTMRQEFGRGYDQNIRAAQRAIEDYGGEELAQILDQSGLGNNPVVIKAFAKIGKAMTSDKDLLGSNERSEGMTPDEAKSEAARLMANPAYTDKRHPEHAKLVTEVRRLFEQAYG